MNVATLPGSAFHLSLIFSFTASNSRRIFRSLKGFGVTGLALLGIRHLLSERDVVCVLHEVLVSVLVRPVCGGEVDLDLKAEVSRSASWGRPSPRYLTLVSSLCPLEVDIAFVVSL